VTQLNCALLTSYFKEAALGWVVAAHSTVVFQLYGQPAAFRIVKAVGADGSAEKYLVTKRTALRLVQLEEKYLPGENPFTQKKALEVSVAGLDSVFQEIQYLASVAFDPPFDFQNIGLSPIRVIIFRWRITRSVS